MQGDTPAGMVLVPIGLALIGLVGVTVATIPMPAPATMANEKPASSTSETIGYDDVTNIGFAELYVYYIDTPDGSIPCVVAAPRQDTALGIDCDWTVIR